MAGIPTSLPKARFHQYSVRSAMAAAVIGLAILAWKLSRDHSDTTLPAPLPLNTHVIEQPLVRLTRLKEGILSVSFTGERMHYSSDEGKMVASQAYVELQRDDNQQPLRLWAGNASLWRQSNLSLTGGVALRRPLSGGGWHCLQTTRADIVIRDGTISLPEPVRERLSGRPTDPLCSAPHDSLSGKRPVDRSGRRH